MNFFLPMRQGPGRSTVRPFPAESPDIDTLDNRPIFGFVEGEIFFPGLPFLTINPMFPVARARAARALEGRGEGRTRASALPTDSLAPPAPRV